MYTLPLTNLPYTFLLICARSLNWDTTVAPLLNFEYTHNPVFAREDFPEMLWFYIWDSDFRASCKIRTTRDLSGSVVA